MRISILTLPLKNNYGGILQAYALQHVLRNMGHDVQTVDLQFRYSLIKNFEVIIKRLILKYVFLRKNILNIMPVRPNFEDTNEINQNIKPFICKHIRLTDPVFSVDQFRLLNDTNDAFIVGSDQVWRPYYAPYLPAFFLDFVDDIRNIKRISYAASFGVDNWEYSEKLSKLCNKLIQKFDYLSVREKSAINFCSKYFQVNPVHVLDPTMLLSKNEYLHLIDRNKQFYKRDSIFSYILDPTNFTDRIIDIFCNYYRLDVNNIMPKSKYSPNCVISDCIFSPVEDWIAGFESAKFVITDSFHGVIFSIIFNKDFVVIGNESRGMARFSSLLKMFELCDRMVITASDLNNFDFDKHVDWDKVNFIKNQWQEKSFDFIINSLM